jgi:hypothetical protein
MIHPASHFSVHIISRGKGRSAIAAAAYIARTRMRDRRIGRTFNYQRKPGLLDQGLVNWKGSPQDLWNAAEKAEKRCNARVARELRPALPAELPLADQTRLVHGFCCWLKDEFGIASHYAIHAPTFRDKSVSRDLWSKHDTENGLESYLDALRNPDITNLNYHAHIMISTRAVDTATGLFGRKVRELDNIVEGRAQILRMRKEWERRTNAALKKAGSKARIDLRSYKDMAAHDDAPEGLEAQKHLGPLETASVRKAKEKLCPTPTLAEMSRDYRQARNENLWTSWQRLKDLKREKAQLISEQREAERKQRAADEKARIAKAQTRAQFMAAIEAATTIDVISYGPAVLKRIHIWAKSANASSVALDGIQGNPVMSEASPDQVDFDDGKVSESQTAQKIDETSLSSRAGNLSTEEDALAETPTNGMSNEIAVDRKDRDDPTVQAIAWSQNGGPLPGSNMTTNAADSGDEKKASDLRASSANAAPTGEFDEPIDPETFVLTQAEEPPAPRIRVVKKERGRGARGRGD